MNLNLTEDILIKTGIAYQDLIGEAIFVNENPAKIEIVNISKINSDIKRTVETKEYKLIHHSTEIREENFKNTSEIISKSIDRLLVDNIVKNTDDIEVVKYYKKKLFGLLSTNNLDNLLSTTNYFNWVIVNNKVYKDLSKLPNFEKYSIKKGISKIGVYNGISFFHSSNLDDDLVILGVSDSITAVFLQDISINQKSNIYDIGIDYLFVNKNIRKLILE